MQGPSQKARAGSLHRWLHWLFFPPHCRELNLGLSTEIHFHIPTLLPPAPFLLFYFSDKIRAQIQLFLPQPPTALHLPCTFSTTALIWHCHEPEPGEKGSPQLGLVTLTRLQPPSLPKCIKEKRGDMFLRGSLGTSESRIRGVLPSPPIQYGPLDPTPECWLAAESVQVTTGHGKALPACLSKASRGTMGQAPSPGIAA